MKYGFPSDHESISLLHVEHEKRVHSAMIYFSEDLGFQSESHIWRVFASSSEPHILAASFASISVKT